MKNGRKLPDVLMELKAQNQRKRDLIVPASQMTMHDDGQTFQVIDEARGMMDLFRLSDLAHRQIGSALGIPAKYYDLMAVQKPELLAANVNEWLVERPNSYMLRTFADPIENIIRAFLSDKYRRIDNLDIALNVLPLFGGCNDYEIVSTEITDRRFYLKIINHRLEKEVAPGDYVQAGVVISNSEVGLGAVSVQPLLYRLVCTNGMIVNDFGERKNHIGRTTKTIEESYQIYSDETIEAEDKAFLLKLRDTTMAAIDETRFGMVVGKLQESVGIPIKGRVQDVIELTSKSYGLNQPEQDSILEYLIQGGDLTKYGLSNAITRASQDILSYDRATELEGIGWQVATMPASQWKALNE